MLCEETKTERLWQAEGIGDLWLFKSSVFLFSQTSPPTFIVDLTPDIASWPCLGVHFLFEAGKRYLQHSLTRAIELGTYCRYCLHPPWLVSATHAVDLAFSFFNWSGGRIMAGPLR